MTDKISIIKPMHWVAWAGVLVAALICYPWSVSSSWLSNSDVHALFEFWAAFAALTAGLIIMIHYFANGSWLFLIISLGFVLQGGEDLVHAVFSFSRIWGEEQKDMIKFIPGTYASGRFILIACILFAWFLREKVTGEARRIRISFLVVVFGIAVSILLTMCIIKSHLPSFIIRGHIVTRPADFIAIPFYLAAAALYIKEFMDWKYHTPFVYSIICSLIFGMAAQIYMIHSQGLYDSQFDMAHVMKIFSYVCPILGISLGTFSMYKKEAEHGKTLAFSVQKEKELTAVLTLTSIGDAVIATDSEGNVMLINRVAEELTGWSRDEATGKPLSKTVTLLDETTRDKSGNPADTVFKEGPISGHIANALLVVRDGAERIVEISGAPIRDIEEKTIGAVLVFRDITERRRIENELCNAKRLESIAILAAGIAHEINNPLTNASLQLQILQAKLREGSLDTGDLQRLEMMGKNIDRAAVIASDLLHFSRQSDYEFRPLDVNELIRNSLALLEYKLKNTVIYLDLRDVSQVFGDMARLEQVFINIIKNAVEAMPEKGELYIAANQLNGYVEITFRDTGAGIPHEVIGKIFDPFFTTKELGEGTGLGLAICYGIIKKHYGIIDLSSETGKGTTVSVRLKAHDQSS